MKSDVSGRVAGIAQSIVEPLGLGILKVDFVMDSGQRTLRVILASPNGVTIEDCARVSKALSKRLDEDDFIDESYFLEVSSPGADLPGVDDSPSVKGDSK